MTLRQSIVVLGIVVPGSTIPNAQLVAIKTADTGCPAGPVDPVGGTAVGSVVYFPAKTDSNGIAKVALPPGTWTIKAVGGLTGWPSTTLSVDDTGNGQTTTMTVNMGVL